MEIVRHVRVTVEVPLLCALTSAKVLAVTALMMPDSNAFPTEATVSPLPIAPSNKLHEFDDAPLPEDRQLSLFPLNFYPFH